MDYAVVQGRAEPLAVDTPVPTPAGWTTMGEISPGDQVFGRSGRPATVAGVGPVHHDRECYKVTLKNGEQIVADAGHTWPAVVRDTASRKERSYTTAEMYEIWQKPYSASTTGFRISLGEAPVLDLPEADLLVDPYVLGAWLGDGYTAGAAICGDWDDLKYIASEIEERGYATRLWDSSKSVARSHEAARAAVIGVPGGLLAALSAIGVLGGKRIPADYLRSSARQRLDLLRGLMDTDGTVDREGMGQSSLSSKDEVLARQVLELVRSLGYRATLYRGTDSRSRTGLHWRVRFRSRLDCIPFLLPRKAAKCEAAGDPFYTGRRSVTSIEPVPSVPVRCITVDTEDHLFLVGDGFVPTHNSRLAAAAGVHPTVVGFSEGLQGSSLNAGNFQAARRLFGEKTLAHLWGNVAPSLQSIVKAPPGASLWYDDRIPFMRQDAADQAAIQLQQAQTIGTLVKDGFTPDSAVKAVKNNDMSVLVHTGLVSVQLLPPGEMIDPGGGQPPRPPEEAPPAALPASNGTSSSGKVPAPRGGHGSLVRGLGGYPGSTVSSGSGMISLDLPEGTIEPVPGGLDDHHITVVYLGPDVSDEEFAQACARALDAAAAAGPLSGTVYGIGLFPPSDSSDGKMPVFAEADIPGASDMRSRLEDLSASEHADWVPHVTLCYAEVGDALPAPVPPTPVTFTHLSVHRGDEVRRFPLGVMPPAAVSNGRVPAAAG
jgi:2'-5' RNA ligase